MSSVCQHSEVSSGTTAVHSLQSGPAAVYRPGEVHNLSLAESASINDEVGGPRGPRRVDPPMVPSASLVKLMMQYDFAGKRAKVKRVIQC